MNSIATVQILRTSVYLFVCRGSYVGYRLLTAGPPSRQYNLSLCVRHKMSSYVLAALLRVTGKL